MVTVRCAEDGGVPVFQVGASPFEVLREMLDECRRYGQRSPGCLRLGWADHGSSTGASGHLFSNGDSRPVEIDPALPETSAFAPAETQHRTQVCHCLDSGPSVFARAASCFEAMTGRSMGRALFLSTHHRKYAGIP